MGALRKENSHVALDLPRPPRRSPTLPGSLPAAPAPAIQHPESVAPASALDQLEADGFGRCGPHSKACLRDVLSSEQAAAEFIPADVLAIHAELES